jgi:hypothetical protein
MSLTGGGTGRDRLGQRDARQDDRVHALLYQPLCRAAEADAVEDNEIGPPAGEGLRYAAELAGRRIRGRGQHHHTRMHGRPGRARLLHLPGRWHDHPEPRPGQQAGNALETPLKHG